jgi:nicotinate phosphoribosyltransferase
VEVDGIPVQKRSSHKESHGGRKHAVRYAKSSGTIVEEVIYPVTNPPEDTSGRLVTVPLVRNGDVVASTDLGDARARVADGLTSLPWEGLKLSAGEPAISTRVLAP